MKRVVEVLVGLGYNGREQGWEAAGGLCCACAAVGRSLPRMCFVCRAKGCLLAGPAALNSLTRLLWHRGCGTDLHKAPRGHFQLRRQLWGRERRTLCDACSFVSVPCCHCSALTALPSSPGTWYAFFFSSYFFPLKHSAPPKHPMQFPQVMLQL